MTKRFLAIFGFAYACVGTLGVAAMYVGALLGKLSIPDRPNLITTAIAVNVGTWILALYRPIGEAHWEPVLRVTRFTVGIAKSLLGVAVLIVPATLVYLRGLRGGFDDEAVLSFVMSLVLLQMVCLAIYWGLRPENVFPPSWIRRWNSPNQFLVRAIKKRRVERTRVNRNVSVGSPREEDLGETENNRLGSSGREEA